MKESKIKVIVTLGPATRSLSDLRKMKARGVDFVRVNMSHSSLADQEYFMRLAKEVGIPFILDTEGSQIRNGPVKGNGVFIPEGSIIELHRERIEGDEKRITLSPHSVISTLEAGDIIYIDFNSLILRVLDTSPREKSGYVIAHAIAGGRVGSNKAVVVDSAMHRRHNLPALSEKDREAIEIAKREGVGHIAFSFARSGADVRHAREISGMRIIAKIECLDGLDNLPDIIKEADALLIDRGDLSKEIPIERVPFAQKAIIRRAEREGKEVYVATNLLESMVEKKEPTRAEVHDIISTILDGASGLALAAETAIGKYPIGAITTLNKIIRHTEEVGKSVSARPGVADSLLEGDYLRKVHTSSLLIPPHGGVLVDRVHRGPVDPDRVSKLPRLTLTNEQYMDLEQIALGTFSPLEGFMVKADVESVLSEMQLSEGRGRGVVWPIPIVLDVRESDAHLFSLGEDVALCDANGSVVGLLHLAEKFSYDPAKFCEALYGTTNPEHPGVRFIHSRHPVFLGGKVTLFKRREAHFKAYELSPRQARRIFEENGWGRIVGFHTRNVPHRGHEFIQEEALRVSDADGLFVHPVIGKKKPGDFEALPIIKAYEMMMEQFYPKGRTVFGTFATFSRYAGPREAIFTALCRKNFGCSHFVVGRDHTGVGNFYSPTASHEIFDRFPDIGIIPVRFDDVFYSKELQRHSMEDGSFDPKEKLRVSGTEARRMFLNGEAPPEWFMRPQIANMILALLKEGKEVFVSHE